MTPADGVSRLPAASEAEDFFRLNGSGRMLLPWSTARLVCLHAARRRQFVDRIECAPRHGSGFAARLDAIWQSPRYPPTMASASRINRLAAGYVEQARARFPVVIVTTVSWGW